MWTVADINGTFWFFNVLSVFLVAVRIYVRLTTVYRPWRELLLIFALFVQFWYCISQTIAYARYDLYPWMIDWKQITKEQFEGIKKFTTLGICAYQAVLQLMYMDLCPRHVFPKIWMLIMVNWAILAGSTLCSIIYTFFGICPGHHFAYSWYYTDGSGDACDSSTYIIVINSISCGNELLLYLIPILIVYQMPNLTRLEKIGIAAMFSVGFVNLAMFLLNAIMAAPTWPWNPASVGLSQFVVGLWIPTGLIVICMPQLRVLGRWKFARKVVRTMTRSMGAGTTSHTDSAVGTQLGGESELPAPNAGEKKIITVIDEEKGIVERQTQTSSASGSV